MRNKQPNFCVFPVALKRGLARLVSFCISASLIVIASLNSHSEEIKPIQYSIGGDISFLAGDGNVPKFVRPFEVTYSNGDWCIHLVADDLKGVDSYDVVHLGNTIYSYTSIGKLPPNTNIVNNATAVISAGDVPPEQGAFTSYIWLALASSAYFKNVTNDEVHPIWTGIDTKNLSVKAHWVFFDKPPYLLKHIIYYGKAGRLPPPFDNGWKASEFHVTSETNVESYNFPMESEYEQFKPNRGTATNVDDLVRQFRVKVVVRSVQLDTSGSIFPPATRGATLVEDFRFRDISNSGIVYLSKKNHLPDQPESAAIEQHKAQVSAAQIKNSRDIGINKKVKAIICLILILSTLALIVFVAKKTTKQTKKTK